MKKELKVEYPTKDIDKQIEELQAKKKQIEKELSEKCEVERKSKEEEEAKLKADFFKDKKEKDFYLLDPYNVMAFGKIQNFTDTSKPFHLVTDFERDNSKIKVVSDLVTGETFEVFNDKKKWGRYSMEYYNRALETTKAWKGGKLDFYISKEKDCPLLMANDDMGFVLAPRIESEDN